MGTIRIRNGQFVTDYLLSYCLDDFLNRGIIKPVPQTQINTGEFQTPNIGVGESINVISSDKLLFDDINISGVRKYTENAIANDFSKGISLNGKHFGGVKAEENGTALRFYSYTDDITSMSLGSMDWTQPRELNGIYDFRNIASIDASSLAFQNPDEVTGNKTLLSGATNLAAGKGITGASHSQDYMRIAENGVKLPSTLRGTLSTSANALNYTATGTTINNVNLSGWDGTEAAVLSNWTGEGISVTAAGFSTPSTAVGETQAILTSEQEGFFGTVTGANAYEEHDITNDAANGVTFAGQHREGVKIENDGKLLNYYATTDDIHDISLGEMTWGFSRALGSSNYDFRNLSSVDASNLTFSNAADVTGNMTLVSDATNLTANKEIMGSTHTQNFDTTFGNGVKTSSTLEGTLSTTAGALNYAATGTTVNSVSLSNWDGTTSVINSHWEATAVNVDTGNFAAPTTLGTHESQDILTTNREGFFSDDSISGAHAYSEEDITDDASQGVSYSGLHFEGVQATDSGKKLIYFADTKDVYNIFLGEMTWGAGRTTNTGYDFRNLSGVDATDLSFTNPYDVNGTMLLIGNAANLASTTAITGSSHAQNFSYTRGGAKFDATLNGTVEAETNTIKYTKTNATINNIDLSEWDGTTPLELPEGAAATGVEIDTGTFTPPTLTPGTSSDVITTDVEGFFSDDKISGDEKYQERDFSDDGGLTDKGVSFSGKQDSGYKSSDNGKKLIYDTTEKRVEEVTLGELKGNEAVSAPTGYDFTNTDTIDATGFTFENPADVSGTKDIFTGVTGLADGTTINGANHSQDYDKTEGNGAKLSETLKGTISVANEKIQYTKTDEILNGVDLSGWDGTNKNITGKTAKENGVDILTSGFDVPALGVNESQDILTSDSDIFSGANITGSHAYTNEALENDTANGVLLDGSHYGGVKASDDGKKLSYFAETNNITDITLGEMTWGVSRAADSSYDFRDVGTISADNLRFTNAQDADGTMELLKNAQNLNPSATITGTPHSQDFTYSKGGATFNGTLTGTVALDGTSVKYTRTGTTLKNVDLSGWDGTTDIDTPSDWTKEAGTPSVEIDTGTMDSPDVGPGQTKEIITTGTEGTFSDDDIKGDEKYHTRELKNEKVNGVDFSGTQDRGFKTADNGKKLVYEADEKKVEQITLTDFDKGEGTRTASAGYDFTNTDKVDATGLAFKDPENVNAPVTILDGATNLPNGTTVDGADHTQEFEKGLTNGIDMKVDLKGNVTVQDEKVTYTPTAKDVKEVDVSGWNGENTSNVPDGWTGTDTKIKADTIDGSKVTDNDKKDILVSETAIFNDDNITGDQKYQERNRSEEKNGIGFGGTQESGVKTDDGGKKLVYQKSEYNVKEITLKDVDKAGNAIPFAAPAGYDFSETAKINGENLNFADPEHVEGNVDILTGATGLQDGVIVSGGDDHKQAFNKELENGINLGVNLEGTISAKDEKVVFETTGKDVTSVDLKAWNGETTAQTPDGWTGKDVKVKTDGLSDANIKDGESKDILTSGGEAIFKDESISGEQKYGRHGREEAGSGVILSGSQNKGVKTSEDHTKLVYEKGLFEVANIGVKDFEFGKPMEITANYDFSNADVDPKNVSFRKPEEIAAGSFTVILKANETLADINKEAKAEYSAAPVAGVSVDATLVGKFKSEGDTLSYTAESNRASQLTFGDVEWLDSRPLIDHTTTMKNVSFEGANVDTTKINFTNIQAMEASRRMTLVKDFGATIGNIEGTEYTVGSVYKGKGVASLEGKDLVFTAQTGTEKMQEQTHNTLMGAEAAVASLSAGDEFIKNATNEIGNPANIGADGVSIYAKMGVNSMRQETGSHIKANTWNAILSVGKQKKFSDSTLDYGFFYEHGQGNYTAYNGDLRGDGNITYNGGGLLAKWKKNDGFYVDGSLRIGRLKDKSNNMLVDMYGRGYSYETDAPYFGGHIGVGKEFDVGHGNAVDVYAKYTYGQRNAVSFDAGGHYELDAVRSQVFSIGARYLMKRDKWNFYGGLAYEHELDGRATGRVTAPGAATSEAIRSASTAGGSIKAEIGASMKPDEDSPWSLDLNVAGFAGQKQGVQGSVSVSLAF